MTVRDSKKEERRKDKKMFISKDSKSGILYEYTIENGKRKRRSLGIKTYKRLSEIREIILSINS